MNEETLKIMASIAHSIDWSAWVTAIATLLLALLTFVYVRLTKGILENQSNPCVIVSVIHDDERPTVLQLVVKNVGTSVAQDISFELSRPIPARAWGISDEEAKSAEPMTDGPFIDGIPALGPGEKRRIDWGQYGGLKRNLGSAPIVVKCKFKKNGRTMKPMICKLDVKSFEGTVAAERPIAKIAKELEKMSKDLHDLKTGFHKFRAEFTDKSASTRVNLKEDGE
jgi:hypothetical protein